MCESSNLLLRYALVVFCRYDSAPRVGSARWRARPAARITRRGTGNGLVEIIDPAIAQTVLPAMLAHGVVQRICVEIRYGYVVNVEVISECEVEK
ncbi:hypothetical protein Tco_1289351 [Tanacetum coccineum]